jgi:hypothetical protein
MKRQGMTSVVPKATKIMLGFSPCVFLFSVVCSSAEAEDGIPMGHLWHD